MPLDQIGAAGLDDRQHAFAEGAELDRRGLRIEIGLVEIIDVGLGEHVARVRKRRHPAAVLQLRVPADVIVMQVRAHHQVDLVRPRAGGGEPVEIGRVQHAPPRPRRAHAIVAAAGVDQDLLPADLQQPAVHAELDLGRRRIVVAGREPVRMLVADRVGEFGKQLLRVVDRADKSPRSARRSPCRRRTGSCAVLLARYLGRKSLVKVDGKSIGDGPSGCRYACVARACASVICPVIGQIWLTVA